MKKKMIPFDEAYKIVTESAVVGQSEQIDLQGSLNRILAEDIFSDMDMPPFNKSAVDGYACKKDDLNSELTIIETIPAGVFPRLKVGKGECSKIMTGAPIPEGAEVVIMVEDTEDISTGKIRYIKDRVKDNVCYTGEDIKKGQVLLKKGQLIEPQHIAVLATAGKSTLRVYKKIRVGVISTGDELVEPEVVPARSQIRNSNAYQLLAQIEKAGATPDYIGIARDTEESTRKMIIQGFSGNDVVLLTGGVSMGDYDYVPNVLNELEIDLKFTSIAVQPGRPTVFGTRDKQVIFGLPGNPVSSFVQFELLVKPLIYKMSGHIYKPVRIRLTLAKDYTRKRSTRLSWLPVKINQDGEVMPLEYHGSAHINALTEADGLISVPIGTTKLNKGELVDVRQI